MSTYGSTIKRIRKSKGLMLKELSDENLSISLLSQFENNRTSISCERFHSLLEKLEISYEEFFAMHSGKKYSESKQKIVEYIQFMEVNSLADIVVLRKAHQELACFFQQNYSLELDHFVQLTRFDLEMKAAVLEGSTLLESLPKHRYYLNNAKSYLLNTETWGIYELKLFSRIAVSMEPSVIWHCLKQALKKSERYVSIQGNKQIIYETLIAIFSIFCLFKEKRYATKTLEVWKMQVYQEENVEQAVFFPFYDGWIAWLNQEKKQAAVLMDSTLRHLENLSLSKTAIEYSVLKRLILADNFPGIILKDPLFERLN
jgi:Rgg/GadR/MutR family transcriptional activator